MVVHFTRNLFRPRFLSLKYRFIFLSSLLLIVLLGCTAVALVAQQSISIRGQVEARGLAIAESLAASSRGAFLLYNYIALEQTAEEAAKNPDVAQVIIHDKEGRVAGFSGRPELQGTFLEDPWSRNALQSPGPLVQERPMGGNGPSVLDCAAPVLIEGSPVRWGTVRVVVSLEPMYAQIRWTQGIIIAIGVLAVVMGMATAGWAAGRITRPLGRLTRATMEAAQGNLNQVIEVHTQDEVEILARNFSSMIAEILDQRQQLENQLREIRKLQRYTESLLATMNDGLFSVDSRGRVATMNPAAEKLLRVQAQQGAPLEQVLKSSLPLVNYVEEMLRGESGSSQREIRLDREGKARFLLVNSSRLMNPDGTLQELITNVHDFTELKEMEARMRQAERLAALGTLAAGMAHEIRNPLSAIKTFVQLLPRKLEKPGFLEKFNRTVPRELDRINRLVEDLLELSREVKFRFKELDVRMILRELFELFEEELQSHDITARLVLPRELPEVWADPAQLMKAFQNLLRNAVQAMPSGGEVSVEVSLEAAGDEKLPAVSRDDERIRICFQDTGMGIPAENLPQIFNPFFTTKDNGTGLGLAITHKVITEHGGLLEAGNRPGGGAFFTVLLQTARVVSKEKIS